LHPADGAAIRLDHTLVLLDKGIDLLRREVLPGKEHMFIESHVWSCLSSFHTLSVPAARASATSLSRGAGEERSNDETVESGDTGGGSAFAFANAAFPENGGAPSVQPPAGTGRWRRLITVRPVWQ